MEILGVPIGDIKYIDDFMIYKIIEMENEYYKILSINDKQNINNMITSFTGLCKIGYLLQNIDYNPNYKFIHYLNKFDMKKKHDLFGQYIPHFSSLHIDLPGRLGGHGMRKLSDYFSAAFIANQIRVQPILKRLIFNNEINNVSIKHRNLVLESAINDYNSRISENNYNIFNIFDIKIGKNKNKPLSFKYLTSKIDIEKREYIYNNTSDEHRIILDQLKYNPLSNKSINIPKYMVRIDNEQWSIAMWKRYCIPISSNNQINQNCFLCNQPMDPFGRHSEVCSKNNTLNDRHNGVTFILDKMAKLAGFKTIVEATNLIDHSKKRPCDLTVFNFQNGDTHLGIDVGIVCPITEAKLIQNNNNIENKFEKGIFSRKYYNEKRNNFNKLQDMGKLQDYILYPFILETYGYMHKDAIVVFDKLCKAIADKTFKDETNIKNYWRSRLMGHLIKSDAIAVLARYDFDNNDSCL